MSKARQQRRKLERERQGEKPTAPEVAEQTGLSISAQAQEFVQESFKLHYGAGNPGAAQFVMMAALWVEIVSRLGMEHETVKQVRVDVSVYAQLLQMIPPETMQKIVTPESQREGPTKGGIEIVRH